MKFFAVSVSLISLSLTGAARADTLLFDFGSTDSLSSPNYNNVTTGIAGGGTLSNLINSSGASTHAALTVKQSFWSGANLNGTTAPAASTGFISSATLDNFFGTDGFQGKAFPQAQVEISGLDPAARYSFTFFASRMGVTNNRETSYQVTGASVLPAVLLNPSNNTANVAVLNGVQPSANGAVLITLKKGPANNDPYGFYYLGAMRIVSGAAPAPSPIPSPKPSGTPSPVPSPSPLPGGAITLRPAGTLPATSCGFGEYLPPGYASKGGWPLLIFLHGLGEVYTTLDGMVSAHGPLAELRGGRISTASIPMVVLEPQESPACNTEDPVVVDQFLTFALARYTLDAKKVSITGLSLGGGSTDKYMDAYPTRLAAAIPLSANASSGNAAALIANGVAVWAGTSRDDSAFPSQYPAAYGNDGHTLDTMNAIWRSLTGGYGSTGNNGFVTPYPGVTSTYYYDVGAKKFAWLPGMEMQVGGMDIDPPYLLTLWPGSGHSTPWGPMYSNPRVYQWLLRQSR